MKSSQVCQKWQTGIDNLGFLSLRSDSLNVTNEKTNAMLLFVEAEQRIDHSFSPRKHKVKILYFEDQSNNSNDIWQGETNRQLLLLIYICFSIWHRQGQRALTISSTVNQGMCLSVKSLLIQGFSILTEKLDEALFFVIGWKFIHHFLLSNQWRLIIESPTAIITFEEPHGWIIKNLKNVQIICQ